MKPHCVTTRAPYLYLAAAMMFLSVSGCDGNAAPAAADQDEARKTLDQALSAWQKGETIEAMKNGSPAIHVADDKWTQGATLKKYEVEGQGKASGAEREFTVKLWFVNSKGKEVPEQVVYRVGTQPIFTVFRALF